MNTAAIDEIVACMPKGRTPFHYFKNKYALDLLSWEIGDGKRIQDIKAGPYSRLLNKPLVRQLAARAGDGTLQSRHIQNFWPEDHETYLLTLGSWGNHTRDRIWNQTSRPGNNLVLHLNFPNSFNREYKRRLNCQDYTAYSYRYHPNATGHHTLAWIRMDIDWESDVVLIEEIQNDWLRMAKRDLYLLRACLDKKHIHEGSYQVRYIKKKYDQVENLHKVAEFLEEILPKHSSIWDEAAMNAVLWFIRKELGIKTVYYNTHRTGNRLKGIKPNSSPPKSMYTDLPKRFCFQETSTGPEFLERQLHRRFNKYRKHESLRWYLLGG
jgi:hypothetical protein